MLNYLWNYDQYKGINWGLKNLEFMLILANDLCEIDVFEILLSPKPFATVMKSIPFGAAMDFIEDHIINNGFIPEEMKLTLLNSEEMIPYSFIGAFLHFSSRNDTQNVDDEP